jgi:hypothetical protein
LTTSFTVKVKKMVLGGVTVPNGFYTSSDVTYGSYIGSPYITVQVGEMQVTLAESITINGPTSVALGEQFGLGVIVLPASASPNVTWSVAPEGIADVDVTGWFTAGTQSGCATVTATATDGSGVFGTHQIAIGGGTCGDGPGTDPTGVESHLYGTVVLSPNPTPDKLTVASNEFPIAKIAVYTANGSLLQQVVVSGSYSHNLSLYGYATGTYIVTLWLEGQSKPLSYRIVKQ